MYFCPTLAGHICYLVVASPLAVDNRTGKLVQFIPMLSNVKWGGKSGEQTGGLTVSIFSLLLAALAGGVDGRQTSWRKASASQQPRLTSFEEFVTVTAGSTLR
jgi:hypothetical protein